MILLLHTVHAGIFSRFILFKKRRVSHIPLSTTPRGAAQRRLQTVSRLSPRGPWSPAGHTALRGLLTACPLQAEKNLLLQEKIQVLQQRNEDLKARIDQNTVVTRWGARTPGLAGHVSPTERLCSWARGLRVCPGTPWPCSSELEASPKARGRGHRRGWRLQGLASGGGLGARRQLAVPRPRGASPAPCSLSGADPERRRLQSRHPGPARGGRKGRATGLERAGEKPCSQRQLLLGGSNSVSLPCSEVPPLPRKDVETPPSRRQHGGRQGVGLRRPAGGYTVHEARAGRQAGRCRCEAAAPGARAFRLAGQQVGRGQTSVRGRGRHSPGRGGQMAPRVPGQHPPLSPAPRGPPHQLPRHFLPLPLAFAVCTGRPAPPHPGRGMSVHSVWAGGPGDKRRSRFGRGRVWRQPALSLTPHSGGRLLPWPVARRLELRPPDSLAYSCPRADSCRRRMLTSRSTWRRRRRRRRG